MPVHGEADAPQESDGVVSTQTVEEDENSSSDEGDGVCSV